MPKPDIEDKCNRRKKHDKSKEKHDKNGVYSHKHIRNAMLVSKIMEKAASNK